MSSFGRYAFAALASILLASCTFDEPEAETVDDSEESSDDRIVCSDCSSDTDCGGSSDLCIQNTQTGEQFCGRSCSEQADCAESFECLSIDGTRQCVPSDASCDSDLGGGSGSGSSDCDTDCGANQVCLENSCVDVEDRSDAQTYCVEKINSLRAREDLPPLDRSSELEDCATRAAVSDSQTGEPHGHFTETRGCGGTARAENETPGWSLDQFGSVENIIEKSADQMFAEGSGGGHYENITGDYSAVGCGIYVTDDRDVWVVQNYH